MSNTQERFSNETAVLLFWVGLCWLVFFIFLLRLPNELFAQDGRLIEFYCFNWHPIWGECNLWIKQNPVFFLYCILPTENRKSR